MPGVGRVRRGLLRAGVVRGNVVHADFAEHTNDAKYSKHTEYAWFAHCARHANGAE
jgi:hypothetical protein